MMKYLLWIFAVVFIIIFDSCKNDDDVTPEPKNGGIAINFDGEYISQYYWADSILKGYNLKATLNIPYFDQLNSKEIQQLHELKSSGYEIAGKGLEYLNAEDYFLDGRIDEYLNIEIYGSSNCTSTTKNSVKADASISAQAENEYQIIMSQSGTLSASGNQTIPAYLDGGSLAEFEVQSDEALTYTLIDPNGQMINPTVADTDPNINYLSGYDETLWFYKYQISSPTVGNWQNVLQASNETNFVNSNLTNSAIQLSYKTNKFTYQPGDLVTLETALSNGSVPYIGVIRGSWAGIASPWTWMRRRRSTSHPERTPTSSALQ